MCPLQPLLVSLLPLSQVPIRTVPCNSLLAIPPLIFVLEDDSKQLGRQGMMASRLARKEVAGGGRGELEVGAPQQFSCQVRQLKAGNGVSS